MRVHATLRDDVRLWISAVTGAIVFYAAIVVLGLAPSPFGSLHLGRTHTSPAIVVPRAVEPVRFRGTIVHGSSTTHPALPVATKRAGEPRQSAPATSTQLDEEAQAVQPTPERGTASPPLPAPTTPSPAPSAPPAVPTVPTPSENPPQSTLPLPLPLPPPVNPPPVVDPVAIVPPVTLP